MCQGEQADPGQTSGGVADEVGDIGAPDGQDVLGDLQDQARPGDRARRLPPRPQRREEAEVQAATQRLVLLAPRGDGFGFDVRPLQELNAARFITNGDFDGVELLLEATMASPHWRNTWVFAAGRVFAEQDHLIPRLLVLLTTADQNSPARLGRVAPVGPRLALDLLKDGMGRAWPVHQDRLVKLGMEVLHEAELPDLVQVARLIVRHADTGQRQRSSVAERMRDLLAGTPVTRETVGKMQELIPIIEQQLRMSASNRGLATVRKRPNDRLAVSGTPDWRSFDDEISTAPLSADDSQLLERAALEVRNLAAGSAEVTKEVFLQALSSKEVAAVLEEALMHVTPGLPALAARLRDSVLPDVYRKPALMTCRQS